MRHLTLAAVAGLLLVFATTARAANITGEYLEARTCSVYTGPCFANAEMGLAVADHLEEWRKACLHQHGERVAADRDDFASGERMMGVEVEDVLVMGNTAAIDDGLAIVLAAGIEFGELE